MKHPGLDVDHHGLGEVLARAATRLPGPEPSAHPSSTPIRCWRNVLPERGAPETLVTKVMLGVWAFMPAYYYS